MQLERVEIDGRSGSCAYLDDTLHMVEKDQATHAKVVFDDGSRVFYTVEPLLKSAGGPGSGPQKDFSETKVVDKDGKPLVVYHGSVHRGEKILDPSREPIRGRSGPAGVYFTSDPAAASNYTRPPNSSIRVPRGDITKAHILIKNPLDITKAIAKHQKEGLSFGDAKRKALLDLKPEHDGVVFKGDQNNADEYIVFSSAQIRHAGGPGSGPQKQDDSSPTRTAKHGLKVVCAWCKKDMGWKEGPFGLTSHGMCPQCSDKMLADLGGPGSGPNPGDGSHDSRKGITWKKKLGPGNPEKIFGQTKEALVIGLTKNIRSSDELEVQFRAQAARRSGGKITTSGAVIIDSKTGDRTNYHLELSRLENDLTLERIDIDPSLRNTDTAMKLLSNVLTVAEQQKIDNVDFAANLDKGGFAWARMGAITSDPENLADSVLERLNHARTNTIPDDFDTNDPATIEAHTDSIHSLYELDSESRRTLTLFVDQNKTSPDLPRKLSELKIDGKNVGRHLLRGISWSGRFMVNDKAARERFNHFVR